MHLERPPSSNNASAIPDAQRPASSQPLKRGLTPELLAALTLFVFSLLTYGVWDSAQRAAATNLNTEFEFRAREIADRIVLRMRTYEQVLRGTKAFLGGSVNVEREEFRAYVGALNLDEYYPGIQAVAVSEVIPKNQMEKHIASIRQEGFWDYSVRPAGERDIYTAITKIEPFTKMNLRAFGYDMFSEPIRRAAMERARDSGRAALSGRVILVQEKHTNVQPGFLMYLPMYQKGMRTDTVEQRRAHLIGWVYAPFRINDFMSALGGERSSDLRLTIYDGETKSQQTCIYGCAEIGSDNARFRNAQQIMIADHPWTVEVRSTPAFERQINLTASRLIAGGGLVIAALLALLVWVLITRRNQAMALALEITQELRTSHQQIAAEQQRMKVILENAYDAFVSMDVNGLVTDWNIQAERTFGWTAAEVIGKELPQLIFPEDQLDIYNSVFHRSGASLTSPALNKRIEMVAQDRSGKRIPVELSMAAIRTDSGYITNTFIRDLTMRKEIEEREAHRQRALDDARADLAHAQRMEAVGKLTGGIAHDFNNVLQIMSGNVQLLLHGQGNKEQQDKRLHSIMSAVERGSKLSSQLLAFARRQPLEPKVVNMRRILSNMDDLLRRALGAEVEIETIVGGGLWNTLADPSQLENVILNLAINARDAMSGRGKLTLELGNAMLDDDYVLSLPDVPAGQYVMLAVSDTGTGMTPEVIERAFEPFFTTKPEGQGTGLGLSMAYGFVKQSGGHIRIYSEVGHGTTVKIYLPRESAPEESLPLSSADAPKTGGNETILVVEDDVNVQATVVAMLTDLGYEVLKANDGESALEIIRSGPAIDLLFTDVVMPGLVSSTELAHQAKALLPDVAILFTSGYTQNAIVHGGRLDPGVHLLSKPYGQLQLACKIRQLLEQGRQTTTRAL